MEEHNKQGGAPLAASVYDQLRAGPRTCDQVCLALGMDPRPGSPPWRRVFRVLEALKGARMVTTSQGKPTLYKLSPNVHA